jgi:hypothetical protein
MAEKIGNFVLELVPAPGTGAFTVGGTPVKGRLSWSFGVAAGWWAGGSQVFYIADDTTRQEWGYGTYTGAGTLTRDTVLWTSAGSTAKINFNTLPVYVYPEIPGERSVYRDPASGRLKVPYDISSPTQNQGPLSGHRNRLINSGFQINQGNYISGSNLLGSFYNIFDRWKTGAGGATLTFTAARPATTVTVTAGTIQQIIDGANIEGGTYTLSWTGSGQARVNAGTYAASPITVTGIVGGTNVTVEFNTGAVVSKPMFEPGDTPSQWELRLDEQALCERYRIRGNFSYAGGNVVGNVPLWMTINLPTLMRATPTVGVAASGGNLNVNTTFTASALSVRDVMVQTTIIATGNWQFVGTYDAMSEL